MAVASAAAMFLAVAVSGTAIAATTESPSSSTSQTQTTQSDQKTSDANSTSASDATKSSTPAQTETSKSGKSTTDAAISDSKVVSKDKQAAATPAPASVAAAPQARAAASQAGCTYASESLLQPVCWIDMESFGQNQSSGTTRDMTIDLGGGYTLSFTAKYTSGGGSQTLSATAAPISWSTGDGGHAAFGQELYAGIAGKGKPVLYTSQMKQGSGTVALSNIRLTKNGADASNVKYSLVMADGESTAEHESMTYTSDVAINGFAQSAGYGMCDVSGEGTREVTCVGKNQDSGDNGQVQGIRLFKTDNPSSVSVKLQGNQEGVVFGVLTASADTEIRSNGVANGDAGSFTATVTTEDKASESVTQTGAGSSNSQVIQMLSEQDSAKGVTFTLTGADPSKYTVTFACTNGSQQCTSASAAQYNESTKTWTATAKVNALGSAHGKWVVSPKLGAPEHHKRIKSNNDGTYTLNLDVVGNSTESTQTVTTPLDISLVLDVSGSMDDQFSNSDSTHKISALKNAANAFIDATAKANESLPAGAEKNQIALVKFAGDENDNVGDDTYRDGRYTYNYSQIVSKLTDNLSGLKTSVNALNPGGATRADYGLAKAQESLTEANGARADAKKVVIFFTDGKPTANSEFEDDVANNAILKAGALKNDDTTVYSIGVFSGADPSDTSTNTNAYMNAVSSNYPYATTYETLGARAENADYYKAASNASDLNKIFSDIQQEIVTGSSYTNVAITDTLSKYVKQHNIVTEGKADANGFKHVKSGVKLNVKDSSGKTVTLDSSKYTILFNEAGHGTVKVQFASGYKLEKGYTYTLAYDVELTQTAYDEYVDESKGYNATGDKDTDIAGNTTSSDQSGFHSNDSATVTYTANGRTDTELYPHPVVQAKSGNIKVTKNWKPAESAPADGNASVTVDLYKGESATGNPFKSLTIKKGEDGQWAGTFEKLAPGTYYLQEAPVNGYTASYKDQTVTIKAADLWTDNDTVKTYGATVTNTRNTVDLAEGKIPVNKTLAGRDWKNNDSFSFTIKAADDSAKNTPLPDPTTVTIDNKSTAVTGQDKTKTANFGKITYNATGDYKYVVTETKGDIKGLHYSQASYTVTVKVEANDDGSLKTPTVTITPTASDDGTAITDGKSVDAAAFTNAYVAVSQLPLTGGTTGRAWLVASGVLLAMAGASYAVWRKRQMA
ncbi:DUF7604 domain-containing protein [Bifidobacterium callimiconis]|uniref:DUF7604 domain-containing protein n=1 Tax=Bifidobacterium callimiconis TaxID=2306973 RepID=UPI0013E025E0|nr:FctA domain-containing protein [Bifidobacterium callimiconis]